MDREQNVRRYQERQIDIAEDNIDEWELVEKFYSDQDRAYEKHQERQLIGRLK